MRKIFTHAFLCAALLYVFPTYGADPEITASLKVDDNIFTLEADPTVISIIKKIKARSEEFELNQVQSPLAVSLLNNDFWFPLFAERFIPLIPLLL